MSNVLSVSSVNTYTTCGRKYQLHYIKRLRGRYFGSALLFGASVDVALNHLLQTRNLQESLDIFDKSMRLQSINKVVTHIPQSTLMVYAEKDFDKDLLLPSDYTAYNEFKTSQGLDSTNSLENDVKAILKRKKELGYANLEEIEQKLYNYANWLCLVRKGHILLTSYNLKVIPKIKNVIVVQKKLELPNGSGDTITGYLDFIVEFHDGTIYLMDNKTSSIEYDPDSPMKSVQLVTYYYLEKNTYKLDGVGFVVMRKQILKNKVKTCSVCSNDGTGKSHRSCDAEAEGKRCKGAWNETIDPEAEINIILNKVPEAMENLVLDVFDSANEGIKKEAFGPNLTACDNGAWKCQFINYCHKGDKSELVDLNEQS